MAGEAAVKLQRFTWDDYRTWDDVSRCELIGGEAFDMSPAPSPRHQSVLGELYAQFLAFLRDKPCRVFVAPVDVKLSEEDVVQPDLLVVCEREKIRPTHVEGAPTLVVEILSLRTAMFDRVYKLRLYAEVGVKEVWLVMPFPPCVEVFSLAHGRYVLDGTYSMDDVLASPAFPDLRLDLAAVFDFPLETEEERETLKESRPPYGRRKEVPTDLGPTKTQ